MFVKVSYIHSTTAWSDTKKSSNKQCCSFSFQLKMASAEFTANFDKFADKGKTMTSRGMTKWFKDTGAINKKLNSNSLDICFSKHKPKGQT